MPRVKRGLLKIFNDCCHLKNDKIITDTSNNISNDYVYYYEKYRYAFD